MLRIKISTILFAFILSYNGFSQSDLKLTSSITPCNDSAINLNKDISNFFDDGLNIVKAPRNFNSTELYITGAILVGSGIAYISDPNVKTSIDKNHTTFMNRVTPIGEKYGSSLYAGIFGSGLYLTGALMKNQGIASTGRMVVESVVYTGLVVGLLKFTFSRARPYENDGPRDFFDFSLKEEDISFPSGHTATAFAISTVLSRKIDNTFATIGLYGLAGLTAYERMYNNKHWFSDVLVGAALGYFIGNVIANSEDERESKNDFLNKVDLMPSINSNGVGLSINVNF